MRKYWKLLPVLGVLGGLGCNELTDLDVENTNNPDQARAISSPEDVEGLLLSGFRNAFFSWDGSAYPTRAISVSGDENSSSWGNWHMQHAGTEPRPPFENTTSYSYRGYVQTPWYNLYEVISNARDGLFAVDQGGIDLGDNEQRARAVSKLSQGMAHGYLAMFYDRAFIFDENFDLEDPIELSDYNEVMDAALGYLDEAIAPPNSSSFTIPGAHMGNIETTSAQLARIAHSFKATFRAMVARTPTERAAVDWQAVLSDINAGVTEDFGIDADDVDWYNYWHYYMHHPTWMRADYKTIGCADNSTGYQNWLNTAVDQRQPFDIVTDDKRITAPGDPKADGTDFYYRSQQNFRQDRGTYFYSNYGYKRRQSYFQTFTGFLPVISLARLDLLKAEAHIRLGGQLDQAATLINKTRVTRGGLPPVSAALGKQGLVDALKCEIGIETYGAQAGRAYFDRRGWGDLPDGTPMHWPMPARELETLGMPAYTFGGPAGGTVVTGSPAW